MDKYAKKSLMKYSFMAIEKGEYENEQPKIKAIKQEVLGEVLGEVLHEVLKMLNRWQWTD